MISLLGSYKQGETVEVTLYRNSAGELKKKTIKVTLSNKKVVEEEKKAKEYMIATISHDLKTPLTSIVFAL